MPMHMNRGKTLLQSIGARTGYVMNPDKTDGGLLVSSYECDPASAEVDFLHIRRVVPSRGRRNHE